MALKTKELVPFSLLGAIMFASKIAFEALPNIHPLAMLVISYTVVFRKKALIPIYLFVFITGAIYGFGVWWVPYLYLWLFLWGATMLLPKKMPDKIAVPVYMLFAGLHGLLYGTLYAPFQALAFGLDLNGMVSWIMMGLPFDLIHGVSNFIVGLFTLPVIKALRLSTRSISV